MTDRRDDSRRVEIRLEGHLDPHWSRWLDDLTLTHERDGTTMLRGAVADQAQLHGVLTRIRDLGATLISLTPLDDGTVHDHQTPSAQNGPDHDHHTHRTLDPDRPT